MSYFNYHAKIKSLIKKGEFVKFEIVDNYHGIKPAMIIYFKNYKPMPVREYRFQEYFDIFKKIQ